MVQYKLKSTTYVHSLQAHTFLLVHYIHDLIVTSGSKYRLFRLYIYILSPMIG